MKRLLDLVRRWRTPRPEFGAGTGNDEYDWRIYHEEYRARMVDLERLHTTVLRDGDYTFGDERLTLARSGLLPLHENHRLLYETVCQLNPASVLEIGCGAGDHLANIKLLAPSIQIHGRDRSENQLRFLRERHPELDGVAGVFDATMPWSNLVPTVDVCFTQAVLTHIQLGNSHFVTLANMFRAAARQVILMENWTKHSFHADITRMFAERMISWPRLFLYYRASDVPRQPHIVVASATELPYTPLLDDETLTRSVPPI
ncbi:MAG: class I SAM-dependent methyltransferase [Chloroflexota bacterium]|nr:MAG: class I SAM-dependent methyltransferase [Chloroflexota bacterium]